MRKKFSCDFETTTDPNDCRVWAWGSMELWKHENFKIGDSIDDFMEWCEKAKADLYFHNLKFDGSFITNWLLKHGFKWEKSGANKTFTTVISKMGQWYIIDICYGYKGRRKLHTKIYDSLKKLPFKVDKIAKDFKLPILKGSIDYNEHRPIGHKITDNEYRYLKNDIEIVADALEIQFGQGLDRITAGSDSLAGFKAVFSTKKFEKMFPIFSLPLNENIRFAYRGGFTWVNDHFRNRMVKNGCVFDVNSLYPFVMYTKLLPYGMPIFFKGKYIDDEDFPLYIQHIQCDFELKEGHIPTIQLKKSVFKENEYLKTSNGEFPHMYVTNIDLELMKEHYELYDLTFHEGWKFRGKIGIFKDFIDKWMYIKTHSTGAIKQLAKLMLNSLYGKFATNPNVTGKVPYMKDDGSLGFRIGDEEYRDPVYTPLGVFITSWARYTTITAAQKCYDRIIYCDTDSMHLSGTSIPDAIRDIVDDNKLGFWKQESTFQWGKFLRQKTYIESVYKKKIMIDGKIVEVNANENDYQYTKLNVKCAGMNDVIKDKIIFHFKRGLFRIDDFKAGLTSHGKLIPKQVSGGVVLKDTEFTIK